MKISIERLVGTREDEYEHFVGGIETTLLYTSLKYQRFLSGVLRNSEPIYLLAGENGRLVGALPAFVCYNPRYGNIMNSLPFYGSNGGIFISPDVPDQQPIRQGLTSAFEGIAEEKGIVVSTLITNPLGEQAFYEKHLPHTMRDERIGQITPLPEKWTSADEVDEKLMRRFHQKTRNCIRKAQKSGVKVYHSDAIKDLEKLADIHRQNIDEVGGLSKPWAVFQTISTTFDYEKDYRVYIAEKDGQVIAALLVFYYNRTAEYFIPATLEGYRVYQPMSLLIFEAMREATRRACFFWNWGGTWLTQSGVYNFKRRWGTEDKRYFYYIREYVTPCPLRQTGIEVILSEYPYFYVLPFQQLSEKRD